MKKYIYIALAGLLLLSVIALQQHRLREVKSNRDRYRNNTEVLLGEVDRYRTSDSLNVISVRALELKLADFERFRSADAALISTLRAENKRLERVSTAQLKTIYELRGTVRDSIIYHDRIIVDSLRCIDIADRWFELHGCADRNGTFSGTMESRDSLVYVEYVIPKRFLGFLWKTRRIKERRQEIVSRNPHTVILGAEFITIRK